MRSALLLICTIFILASCNSPQRTQKLIGKGDYDRAISLAVKKLQKNRFSPNASVRVALLEEAFNKAVEEDQRRIAFLKAENSRIGSREIFERYANMEARQSLISPLLPLRVNGREARFPMEDYTYELLAAKEGLTNALYAEAKDLMERNTKQDYRNAHVVLSELMALDPNFRDAHDLRQTAHFKGTDFILVNLNNHSGQIIPADLQRDLLNFSTYGLDDFWTEYHGQADRNIRYDFGIDLNFQSILISPERMTEKEYTRNQRVKIGQETQKDRRGNIVRDSLGNPVKIDRYKDATAQIQITTQQKSVLVGGTVVYRDLQRNQKINDYPLSVEFIFENIFATYKGDKDALSQEDLRWTKNHFIPFPTNEMMVLDAGDEIKNHFKSILRRNKFY